MYRFRRSATAVARLVGFCACLLALGASGPCSGGQRPKCDGSCGSPADTDDCAMCCNTEREGNDCCDRSYPRGSNANVECHNYVTRRWSGEFSGPVVPTDPNAVIVAAR